MLVYIFEYHYCYFILVGQSLCHALKCIRLLTIMRIAHVRLFLMIAINAVQKHFDPFLSTLAISSQILHLLPALLAGWNNQSHPDRQGYHHYMTKLQLCHDLPRLVNGHKKKAPTYYY